MGRKYFLRIVAVICTIVLVSSILMTQEATAGSDNKFSMSYVYFGNTSSYTGMVNSTGGSLNDISPSYFDLNPDGSLKLTPVVDASFISKMHEQDIKVTPFLSNHWDRQLGINALNNKHALTDQIVDAIEKYNLDGVNVDLENLTEYQRDSYSDFVRILREKLPAGKSLSAAVAPKPFKVDTAWQKSYDYAELSKYCDYLMLMTYDQSYQGGSEGPVASAQFVEDSIKNALKEVPAEKIVLGLAFYGRYWKQGSTYGGYGISADWIDDLIKKYRGVVAYDKVYQSPKAVITIKSSDVKPYVFGSALSAGKYNIWYENEESIKYKLKLVQQYNLKGAGSWSLGQESQETWDYYKLWLNGYYFKDAQGHWAVDSIINVAKWEWMKGVSETSFLPEASLNRAQAAAILVRSLGLESTGNSEDSYFNDISGHWAEKEIEIARQYNIIQGIGNDKFGPDLAVTREQIATMLGRLPLQLHGGMNDTMNFNDVTESGNKWSYEFIRKMTGYGILQGYPDGLFHPADNITRAQMAVIMDRTSSYLGNGIVVASLLSE